MSQKTQKVEFYLANEKSGLAFFSTDMGHIFRSNVCNKFGAMLRGKRTHKPKFAYDIVRTYTAPWIYTDLIEYKIVGDAETPLLRCFLFVSKLKARDIITTGQYMNYQTFSNLQCRPPLEIHSHSFHIDLRDTSIEKVPSVSAGITRLVLMSRKTSDIHF